MAKQVYECIGLKKTASIAQNVTETGSWLDIGDTESALSLVLEGAGSTSVTVTYEIGYTKIGMESVPKNQNKNDSSNTSLQNIAPNDSGAITTLTTANMATATGNRMHATLTPVCCRWIRFKVKNNDSTALTNARLIVLFQK